MYGTVEELYCTIVFSDFMGLLHNIHMWTVTMTLTEDFVLECSANSRLFEQRLKPKILVPGIINKNITKENVVKYKPSTVIHIFWWKKIWKV